MKNGARLKGFDQIRRIGKNNRKDVRALKAWTEAAMDMKGWGEAYRVAQQWVKRESSEEACLTLARMARAIGKRDEAVITLTKLIEEHPGNEEARAMLTTYQGTRVAMHAASHQ